MIVLLYVKVAQYARPLYSTTRGAYDRMLDTYSMTDVGFMLDLFC